MGTPAEIYAAGVKKQLRNYYATWLPSDEIRLGDIGELDGPFFSRVSTLSELGIAFQVREDDAASPLSMMSGSDAQVTLKAAGTATPDLASVAQADAGLLVSFARSGAFLVSAAETYQPSIEDMLGLTQKISQLTKSGDWQQNWAVVVRLVKCPHVTIMISRSDSSAVEIGIHGKTGAKVVDLGDATVDISIGATRGDVLALLGAKHITPFFQLMRTQRRFFEKARTTIVRRRYPLPQTAGTLVL